MKKAVTDILVLAIVCTLVFLILSIPLNYLGKASNHWVFGITTVIFFLGFLYNRAWNVSTLKKPYKLFYMVIALFLLFITTSYSYYTISHINTILADFQNKNKRGWMGVAYKGDPVLGYAPVKGARAYHTFPNGFRLPAVFNKEGFRIPLKDTLQPSYKNIDLLFLGCSFTYGDACYAEESFPYLTAIQTGSTYINSGVCGYGLAQMVILAERLLPKYKPKYLVVQHSPWLIDRSLDPIIGRLANPYFTKTGDTIKIVEPIYKINYFDELINPVEKQSKLLNFGTALSYILKEDFYYYKSRLAMMISMKSEPANNRKKAEFMAYSRIVDIARKNGSDVIILGLYNKGKENEFAEKIINNKNVVYLNGDLSLLEYLKTNNINDFNKAFSHWQYNGKDSILIDGHPNQLAHKLISNVLTKEIKSRN